MDEVGADAAPSAGQPSGVGPKTAGEAPPLDLPRASALAPPAPQHKHANRPRRISAIILLVILLVILLALTCWGSLSAYGQYSHVRAEAEAGVAHLKHAQTLLAPFLKQPGIPDADTLQTVGQELTAAERDFARTRRDLGSGAFSLAASAPQARGALDTLEALVSAADEACVAGLDLLGAANTILPLLHGGFFAASTSASGAPAPPEATPSSPPPPALTAETMRQVTAAFEDAVQHLSAAVTAVRGADLAVLPPNPITAQQRTQLHDLLAAWPRITAQLATIDAWLHVAPSLLGLGSPTRLLVELMDRGEMRSTGGFIGDYGVVTIQDGKLQPFTLTGTSNLDSPYIAKHAWGTLPPPQTYFWWPYGGFGLRDSNLSPDFPTSAQMGIQQLAKESGPTVQGVVALTEPAIARMLGVIGPVTVPGYNAVVTEQNLELIIRQYTENLDVVYTPEHEKFTAELGHAFMAKLRSLPPSQLVAIAQAMLTSLRTRDLQVYLSDTTAEALLAQQGFDGALTRGPGDGLTIVDANVSGMKWSALTTVTHADTVQLAQDGTATHHLAITYDFDSAAHPNLRYYLYGHSVGRTYLRVYAPPSAQLASFDGFNGGDEQINASDESNRQMWGGYVWVRDGVPHTLHFTWLVPHAATQSAPGHWSYALTVQHQPGSQQLLDLTVTAAQATGPVISYKGALDQDRIFSAPTLG